jgi:hypothetical protein
MAETGMTIRYGGDLARIQVSCSHQSGMIYVTPAERSWVCDRQLLPAHALAGLFRELVGLRDPRVETLMQTWGIYFRQLPREATPEGVKLAGVKAAE